MLFHSQFFLLLFLPLTLAGYYLCSRSYNRRIWLLIVASLFFYGFWDFRLLPLLIVSVLANWSFAIVYGRILYNWLILCGITLNLLILGIFKYADFFSDTFVSLGIISELDSFGIILPLGISFFTFQQISYLVDLRRGNAPLYNIREYTLYVTFFPQLIAGPIVRHNEIVHQFSSDPLREGLYERFSQGLTLLLIGLAKKVFLADELARLADPVFLSAASDKSLSLIDSWLGTLAFGLQIYFDFSAYSDMAIGLGLMFGFKLPLNFNAPYRACSLREFWHRWHMTLSRFLRDYLYVPLGGNRFGPLKQGLALMITMLLGGLWHGAAWTFVVWGGIHGIALLLNHAWRRLGVNLPVSFSWVITFSFVTVTWILFRSTDFPSAVNLAKSMFSLYITSTTSTGIDFDKIWIAGIAIIVALVGPTSQDFIHYYLKPKRIYAYATGVMLTLMVIYVGGWKVEEFIYFQF